MRWAPNAISACLAGSASSSGCQNAYSARAGGMPWKGRRNAPNVTLARFTPPVARPARIAKSASTKRGQGRPTAYTARPESTRTRLCTTLATIAKQGGGQPAKLGKRFASLFRHRCRPPSRQPSPPRLLRQAHPQHLPTLQRNCQPPPRLRLRRHRQRHCRLAGQRRVRPRCRLRSPPRMNPTKLMILCLGRPGTRLQAASLVPLASYHTTLGTSFVRIVPRESTRTHSNTITVSTVRQASTRTRPRTLVTGCRRRHQQ